MTTLHIDIETYSSVDIKSAGVYKYTESKDFEILIVAYSIGDGPVKCYEWQYLPDCFFDHLRDEDTIKVAHNAAFERLCFRAMGYNIPIEQWRCSAVKAAYCGLPMSLGELTKVLNLGEQGKLSTGSALIRYFCMPVKATKVNGGRTRNNPEHNPDKWHEFKRYCVNDVIAEREISARLKRYKMPHSEWEAYHLDQHINDRGVELDLQLATKAMTADQFNTEALNQRLYEITRLANPNSLSQLRGWIEDRTQLKVESLAKDALQSLITTTEDTAVREVLRIRQQTGKTSIKKYAAMQACVGKDGRARGLFQFYGAGRTGRWAGRLIQLQNLPRNYIRDLAEARELLKTSEPEDFALCYDVSDTLSQLIRTAIVPSKAKQFLVADFSAIEARVIAWLADEKWRLDVFSTHGKIYEASAAMMFNVPLESIGKGSDLRQRGKVAELALGYQGAVGALKAMGAEKMGLSEQQMEEIVSRWRGANRHIVQMWADFDSAAKKAMQYPNQTIRHKANVSFRYDGQCLILTLPSGRSLIYWQAQLAQNRFGKESIRYRGVDGVTKQWLWIDTYGGKLTENIVQAVARDILLNSLIELQKEEFDVVMHVHDEVVCEFWDREHMPFCYDPDERLKDMITAMTKLPDWAKGLPLGADGYRCKFYMKD